MKSKSFFASGFALQQSLWRVSIRSVLNAISATASILVSKIGDPTFVGCLCLAIAALGFIAAFWLALTSISLFKP
jgi:hypothetical protein